MSTPAFQLTAYQRTVRDLVNVGLILLLWRRQGGKTTFFSTRALRTMAARAGALVTFASASLLVGGEVTQREAMIFRSIIDVYRRDLEGNAEITTIDRGNNLSPEKDDDFAAAFEAGRLETRLYHDRTTYSRTLVVAPNPATARGFSGDVLIDEIGFIRQFRELWDAMEPIFSRNPDFRCLMATTPPKDDTHFSHELIVPPVGTTFGVNPAGHLYRSQAGLLVHRVDVDDAEAAGVHLYDSETRAQQTPAENRAKSLDRENWDRNYKLMLATSGTAACSLVALHTAQNHPLSGGCVAVDVDEEIPLGWTETLTGGAVGIGTDLATTEGETSNPTCVAVVERVVGGFAVRLLARWKTADPARSRAIYRGVLEALRDCGVRARGMGIDATNERFFATDLQRAYSTLVSVKLVISSETTVYRNQEMRVKDYLGNLVVNALDDAQLALPAAGWVQRDFRLVRKVKGGFDTEVDQSGNHGDSFDAVKLALDRLIGGAPFVYQAVDTATPGTFADRDLNVGTRQRGALL